MAMVNDTRDVEILCSQLAQVSETCEGFHVSCYNDGDLQTIAAKCTENNMFTLRGFLDAENLFYGDKPIWAIGTNSGPRAAGILLQDHLRQAEAGRRQYSVR